MQEVEIADRMIDFSIESPVICTCFCYIEDRIISINFTVAKLDDIHWRIYLMILLHADGNKGYTFVGAKEYNSKYGNCHNNKFQKCIRTLSELGLIKFKKASGKGTNVYKSPLLAPLWSEDKSTFINDSDGLPRIKPFIISTRRPFALVPKNCLDEMLRNKNLSITAIRLVMKLYKYYKESTFGGVDPNVIHLKSDILYYDSRLFYDIGIDENEILAYLNEICEFFIEKEVKAYDEVIDFDSRMLIASDSSVDYITYPVTILVPKYQMQEVTNIED